MAARSLIAMTFRTLHGPTLRTSAIHLGGAAGSGGAHPTPNCEFTARILYAAPQHP
jgi:hypothetical protein